MAVTAVVGIAVIGSNVVPRSGGAGAVGDPSPPYTLVRVQQVWTTDQAVAVTIQRQDPTDRERYYWGAVTYDQMGLTGWTQTDATTIVRQPDTELFEGLADAVDPTGLHTRHVHGDAGRVRRADDPVTRDPA